VCVLKKTIGFGIRVFLTDLSALFPVCKRFEEPERNALPQDAQDHLEALENLSFGGRASIQPFSPEIRYEKRDCHHEPLLFRMEQDIPRSGIGHLNSRSIDPKCVDHKHEWQQLPKGKTIMALPLRSGTLYDKITLVNY